MSKGIIASQLRFTRGASNLEFQVYYGTEVVATVKRLGRGTNVQWQIEDAPDCTGATREDAATKFLAMNLEGSLKPLASHRWVSTVNGPIGMRYYCPATQETYNKVDNAAVMSQICLGCGDTVSFHEPTATRLIYRREDNIWNLKVKDQSVEA